MLVYGKDILKYKLECMSFNYWSSVNTHAELIKHLIIQNIMSYEIHITEICDTYMPTSAMMS